MKNHIHEVFFVVFIYIFLKIDIFNSNLNHKNFIIIIIFDNQVLPNKRCNNTFY